MTLENMPSSFNNLPVILLCFFCSLLIGSFSTSSNATIHSNETDRLALHTLKSMFHDPSGVTYSWNDSVGLCLWTGVSCGHRNQRVTALDLRNLSIGGNLSPSIGNLSFLRSLHLEDNSFFGMIPNEISRLTRLEILGFANNSFSGVIPRNLSSSLITVDAYRNNLHGEIPTEIGNLLQLKILDIRENNLRGQLTSFIGNFSALQVLDVRTNNLTGTIPYSLGQLKSLSFLGLRSNDFFGIIPPSIFNISSLIVLSLGFNRLHGTLPSNIGNNLPKLKFLYLYDNNFNGPVPRSLSNASNLEHLTLSGNNFSGSILINFSLLRNFSGLAVGFNNLGTREPNDLNFLRSLTNCSKLAILYLSGNQFGGTLPRFIGNFSMTITRLALGNNHIYGSIPPEIGNLVNLNVLELSGNQLTSSIPSAISELERLQYLLLHQNRLQGTIPAFLGNLTLLFQLTLSSNRLRGIIPSSLGNCQQLTLLSLGDNDLTGEVPQQILSVATLLYLDLSTNNLSGHFPSEFGNMRSLFDLNIANNSFTGMIPSTLGSCVSLEWLYLSHNIFSGPIPSTLSSLKSLLVLDLSSNNLSGKIPEFLESFMFLFYLNLAFNHLEGGVPSKGIFNNKTGVWLEGNEKLCGGPVEMHLPACLSERLKNSNLSLLNIIIPAIISCVILTSVLIIILSRTRSARNRSSMSHIDEQSRPKMSHVDSQFPIISYADLSRATNNFSLSNLIGQGSFGSVYKGILCENEKLVAVKVINLRQRKGLRSFISECEALRNIRHRNLIKVITICSSIDAKGDDFKALVYEYMQNGSLEKWLCKDHEDKLERSNLSFIHRLDIAIDVASAIEYLHHHCEPPIVHGDLKAENIFLDDDMVAKVGDFGLSKFLFGDTLNTIPLAESSSIGLRGTVGYVAPGKY